MVYCTAFNVIELIKILRAPGLSSRVQFLEGSRFFEVVQTLPKFSISRPLCPLRTASTLPACMLEGILVLKMNGGLKTNWMVSKNVIFIRQPQRIVLRGVFVKPLRGGGSVYFGHKTGHG